MFLISHKDREEREDPERVFLLPVPTFALFATFV
ncbi:hypothetical protein OPIT5_01045 [Opitutaceae bacterium TAV5]|nr:hypothetical protein OPIT5_01045 [Opitutaceae bacterium TAV5]